MLSHFRPDVKAALTPVRRALLALGPLALPVAVFVFFLLVFALDRLLLIAVFWGELSDPRQTFAALLYGLRVDLVLLCQTLAVPTIALMLFSRGGGPIGRGFFAAWFVVFAAVYLLLEVTSFPFLNEFSSRPNHLFIRYLDHPKEVFATLLADFKLPLLAGLLLTGLAAFWGWRGARWLMGHQRPWPWPWRVLALPLVVLVLFFGARSGFGKATPNPGLAAFSMDRLANEIALNASYSLISAAYHQTQHRLDPAALYGALPADEVIQRVRRHTGLPSGAFNHPELPTLHTQPATFRGKPRNLVIILAEGLGADMVGALGGLPLTPNFDELSRQGVLFTDLHAIGTRTMRGIEGVVSGFPPTPAASSMLKLPLAQENFFTVLDLLRRHGYRTRFFYGGQAHFDNMSAFFLGNGAQAIVDQGDFKAPKFMGAWGVSDEDLLQEAHRRFAAMGGEPFAAVVLTVSNHRPFDFPQGRVPLYEQPSNTPRNSARYSDWALGEFFAQARQAPYFQNTVFLIVADHPERVAGKGLIPVDGFHVPALILAPGLQPQRIHTLASQVDLGPTVLPLLGLDLAHPMIGRDLLNDRGIGPGHAFIQFGDTNGFRIGDTLVVHRPNQSAVQLQREGEAWHPVPLQEPLRRDALAHLLLPSILYHERRYRLPTP